MVDHIFAPCSIKVYCSPILEFNFHLFGIPDVLSSGPSDIDYVFALSFQTS